MKPDNNQRAKLFNVLVLGGITLFSGGLLMVNLIVDPWGLMPTAQSLSSKNIHISKSANERIAHAYLMRQNKFNVLHAGSSRVRYLLDHGFDGIISNPDSHEIYPGKTVYSAGISGANIHVMRRIVEHALALQDISDALLMIDFVAMNDARPDGQGWNDERYEGGRIVESRIAILSNYLSLNMLDASIEKLKSEFLATDQTTAPQQRSKTVLEDLWKSSIKEFYRYDLYGCYTLSQSTVDQLDVTLSELKARNVDVTIMTPLIHYTLFEMIWRTNNWENYKKFLHVIVKTATKYGYHVWHTSPYGPYANVDIFKYDYITDEAFITEPNFYDPGHANHFADLKLLKFIRRFPTNQDYTSSPIAVRLTPDNIDLEIEKLNKQRVQFLAQYPKFIDLVPNNAKKPICN